MKKKLRRFVISVCLLLVIQPSCFNQKLKLPFDRLIFNCAGNTETTFNKTEPGRYFKEDQIINREKYEAILTINKPLILSTLPFWKSNTTVIFFAFINLLGFLALYFIRIYQLKRQKRNYKLLLKKRISEIELKNRKLTNQANELYEINTLIEERQQQIEEQNEILKNQAEELEKKNKLLNERQQIIEKQSRELLEEKYLMDSLMDNMPEFIYFKDIDSKFIKNSRSHVKLFGSSSAKEIIGKSDFDFFGDEHARQAYKDEQNIIKTGKPLLNLVEKEEKKDGTITWVTTTKMPLKDQTGKIVGTFGISKDITQIKNLEIELKERQQQVEQQTIDLEKVNKKLTLLNATKDKFFSIIAHDLKNPFNVILGFSELLNIRFDKMDEVKKKSIVKNIYESSVSVYNLLENLLRWATTQTGNISFEPEEFNIDELIDSNISLLNNLAKEKNLEIKKSRNIDINIYADKNMINAVIRNLISNAIKFTRQGSITIDVLKDDDNCKVSIKDTGIGIPPEKINSIFDIMTSKSTVGTNKESGTGLGLIICKEFIEKNKGTIYVESEPSQGSTFSFSVPGIFN